jgi:glycerophosphoryl diester phosphodiesterase
MAANSSFYLDRPLVLGHRGARDMAPENTLAAFQAALDVGADGFELDVTRCATGEIMVIHDDTVDRTTNGSGRVSTMSFYVVREMDAGAWFSREFAMQRIPSLQETLDLAQGCARVNVELKGTSLRGDGLEAEVAAMIRARDMVDQVVVSSFNPLALARMRRAAPEIACGLLYAPDLPIYLARAWARPWLKLAALHPEASLVDERYMAWARRLGYRVNVWTVNDREQMLKMIALGVDAIITDHPRVASELLGI